jgi:4-hydroxybenzoate polyprenyltransferase
MANNPAETQGPTGARPSFARALRKLARPHQWAKSGFVMLGPLYGLRGFERSAWEDVLTRGFAAAVAFALASSACYVVNDILDAEADRAHPRKRHRPIASGVVSPAAGWRYALFLVLAAVAVVLVGLPGESRLYVGGLLALYVFNVGVYSARLKHLVIADVVSLSSGFVIRVIAGCAAVSIGPSTWLLNCTLFLAMFLAFGKRLGERRTMAEDASRARAVQTRYTDDLLRMAVVVTAVALLVTYAGYVQQVGHATLSLAAGSALPRVPGAEAGGLNVLWLTMLPATYGLLRCIVLVERGEYDDPTELAVKDRPAQVCLLIFGVLTAAAMMMGGQL